MQGDRHDRHVYTSLQGETGKPDRLEEEILLRWVKASLDILRKIDVFKPFCQAQLQLVISVKLELS